MDFDWRMENRLIMSRQISHEYLLNGDIVRSSVSRDQNRLRVTVAGEFHEFSLTDLGGGKLVLENNLGTLRCRVAGEKNKYWVWVNGSTFELTLPLADQDNSSLVQNAETDARAPMPGTVIRLSVKEGDSVEEGQVLAILEAMKMEHTLKAPRAGIVSKIHATVGGTVDAGALVVQLAADDSL